MALNMEYSDKHHENIFLKELCEHFEEVYRFAFLKTRNRADAEDLTQETFMRAWRAIDSYRPGSNAKAWLYKICLHVFINEKRRQQRQPEVELEEKMLGNIPTEKENSFCLGEEVMLAIGKLPPRAREVVLFYADDFSYQEIADILEMPIGTVRSTLHRAGKKLATYLGDYAREQGYPFVSGGGKYTLRKRV